jgi:hypothetical protein
VEVEQEMVVLVFLTTTAMAPFCSWAAAAAAAVEPVGHMASEHLAAERAVRLVQLRMELQTLAAVAQVISEQTTTAALAVPVS